MLVTSALVNKMLKKLEKEKQSILEKERLSKSYIQTEGSVHYKPEYNYKSVQSRLDEIDNEVIKIKHALNVFNTNTLVGDKGLTIDQSLIKMAQLNNKVNRLTTMVNTIPEKRLSNRISSSNTVEYEIVNYDIDEVQKELDKTMDELSSLQIELDKVNMTVTFEIEI